MSAAAFFADIFARLPWFQLWFAIGKPAAAIERQVFGWRATARATGKNVAGACFALRIFTTSWTPSRLQPSSNVSATTLAVRGP